MISLFTVLDTQSKAKSTVDDRLIQQIANGDTEALHILFECICRSIYGFALSITKNTYDAEDVLQETFLTIHQKAAEYKSNGKPMAWIFTIARNYSLMKLRERSKSDSIEDCQIENSIAFSKIAEIDQRLVLQTALNTLDDEERQILMLHAVGGLKNREIANVLGLPLNTVLSKYNRTIKKMRAKLQKECL